MLRPLIYAVAICILFSSCLYDGSTHDVTTRDQPASGIEIDSFKNCYLIQNDYEFCITKSINCLGCSSYRVTNATIGLVYSVELDSFGNSIRQSGMPAIYNSPKVDEVLCAERPFKFDFIVFPIGGSDYIIRDLRYESMKGGSQLNIQDTIPFVDSFDIQGVFGDEGVDKLHVRIRVVNSKTGQAFGDVSYIDQFHLSDCGNIDNASKP